MSESTTPVDLEKLDSYDFGESEEQKEGRSHSIADTGTQAGFQPFSIGQLARMTTLRRIYESYNLDINSCTFKDLNEKVAENRDLSPEAIQNLY